jgi:hypothetical protein
MAQEIELKDGFVDMGAQMLKKVASKLRVLTWVLWSHEYSSNVEHGRPMRPFETQKEGEGSAETLVSLVAKAVPSANQTRIRS